MKKHITIREAGKTDSEAIIQFNINMAWETEERKLAREKITSGVNSLLQKPEYGFYLVAESENEIVGTLMITYEWSDWRNGIFWWIQSVYVKPEFRRQGVYRKMYKTIRKLADEHPGVCGCRLYVEKENEAAQQTYQNLGMTETHYKMFEQEFS